MSIRGSNFENQHPFASDHALVWERCMPDGLLYGVEMSFTPTLFTLGPGFMLVAGRMFEITAAESISISPGSGYARVYVAIDTGGTATENSFDQVSFGVDYAANLDSFAELTQGEININQGAAVYQAEVAVLAINSNGVTAIERQIELVSPGAGTGAFAAIAVTYPAGSTVTVTDGKITYTAPNTNGAALFIIPYAATWIVTATDGTETASQSVEITTEGQTVSVELAYRLPTNLYQEVEYLKSSGAQYISTGIKSSDYSSSFEIELKNVSTITTSGQLAICGGFDAGWAKTLPTILMYNAKWGFYAYGSARMSSIAVAANTMYKLRMNLNLTGSTYSGYVNDNAAINNAALGSDVTTTKDIYLFAANYTTGYWTGTIGETIIKCDGVIKRHYIPCYRKADSKPGMYERISKTFVTNSGTGEFTLGADI